MHSMGIQVDVLLTKTPDPLWLVIHQAKSGLVYGLGFVSYEQARCFAWDHGCDNVVLATEIEEPTVTRVEI